MKKKLIAFFTIVFFVSMVVSVGDGNAVDESLSVFVPILDKQDLSPATFFCPWRTAQTRAGKYRRATA